MTPRPAASGLLLGLALAGAVVADPVTLPPEEPARPLEAMLAALEGWEGGSLRARLSATPALAELLEVPPRDAALVLEIAWARRALRGARLRVTLRDASPEPSDLPPLELLATPGTTYVSVPLPGGGPDERLAWRLPVGPGAARLRPRRYHRALRRLRAWAPEIGLTLEEEPAMVRLVGPRGGAVSLELGPGDRPRRLRATDRDGELLLELHFEALEARSGDLPVGRIPADARPVDGGTLLALAGSVLRLLDGAPPEPPPSRTRPPSPFVGGGER